MPEPNASVSPEAHPWPARPNCTLRAAHPRPPCRPSKRAHARYLGAGLPRSITARRNMFTAVWARTLKGLAGEEVTACASDLRFVSRRGEAIVGMIADDLRRGGVSLSRKDVQHALNRLHRVDLHQAGATDQ